MSKLDWGDPTKRFFEIGIDQGVVYMPDGRVAPWVGLISVKESPHGGELNPYFYDGDLYYNHVEPTTYKATVEAFTYPPELESALGIEASATGVLYPGQERRTFNFAFRTQIGNAVGQEEYKIHLISNAILSAHAYDFSTTADSIDGAPLSWELSAISEPVPGRRAVAHRVLDSRRIDRLSFAMLEAYLFGAPGILPKWPTISQLEGYLAAFPATNFSMPIRYLGDHPPENPFPGDAIGSADGIRVFDNGEWALVPNPIPQM